MLDELQGKGLIIHHWDADGISSAHLLLKRLFDKNIVNKTPKLGNYFLTKKELNEYSKYDYVIIVDMSLPEADVLRLAENAEVFIFDHHLGNVIKKVYHNNPIIKGENPDIDKKAVEKVPHLLFKCSSAESILKNIQWNENLRKLNKEITRHLKSPTDEIDGIIVKKINTTYNIISTITRKVAWESGKNTMVINTGFFGDKDQLYVRSTKNLESMIERGKTLGFKCGGKKEVLGVILPKNKTDSFVDEIIEFLSKN